MKGEELDICDAFDNRLFFVLFSSCLSALVARL